MIRLAAAPWASKQLVYVESFVRFFLARCGRQLRGAVSSERRCVWSGVSSSATARSV